jgi:Ketopantoate reductase PanE/ApbA
VTAGELVSGYDAIVLAVKSADLDGVMADIGPAVKPPAVIVPFLNAMAHVEALTGRFGTAVLGAVATRADTAGGHLQRVRVELCTGQRPDDMYKIHHSVLRAGGRGAAWRRVQTPICFYWAGTHLIALDPSPHSRSQPTRTRPPGCAPSSADAKDEGY